MLRALQSIDVIGVVPPWAAEVFDLLLQLGRMLTGRHLHHIQHTARREVRERHFQIAKL